jgi:CheY-like chemotaxis protein
MNAEKKRVVVVDDDAAILAALQETLADSFIIFTARDGEEAIRVVTNIKPDLVIMDISMPVMDGMEACRILKANKITALIPVLFLTAKNQIEDTQKAYAAGGDSFMAKPFLREQLISKAQEIIQKAEFKKGL